jgi:hypothetical protein
MPAGSLRSQSNPYLTYAWKSRFEFSLAVSHAVSENAIDVVSYSLRPLCEWTAAPRVVKFILKRSAKDDSLSWKVA